jgi:hypothetical protein
MKNSIPAIIIFLIILGINSTKAQDETIEGDSIEVYLIDSYITPELPHKFILSFFTSADCKSKVLIENKYEYPVSKELTSNHKTEIDLTDIKLKGKSFAFVVITEDSTGKQFRSENFSVDLPYEPKIEGESNFLFLCLFGGIVFLVPEPTMIMKKNISSFSLTKEIPVISIRGSGFEFPMGYFSVEYSYIFNNDVRKIFRVGYKQLMVVPFIKYVSPGINFSTNFDGYNYVSPEFSIGWFKILNTFVIYTRARYNFIPGSKGKDFGELSLGLYSSFFSIYF